MKEYLIKYKFFGVREGDVNSHWIEESDVFLGKSAKEAIENCRKIIIGEFTNDFILLDIHKI